MPGCWVEGEEAGTGEALAGIILRSLRARVRGPSLRCHDRERRMGAEERDSTIGQTEMRKKGDGDGDRDEDEDQDGEGNGDKDENENVSNPPKVIFLTGETRRDIIPRVLREGGVSIEEIVIYETRVDDKFEAQLQSALRDTEALVQTSGVRWIVVFSGQGAREMLRGLGWLDGSGRVKEGWLDEDGSMKGEEEETRRKGGKDDSRSRSNSRSSRRRRRNTFVASIGPTTAEYLKNEFGLQVDVCAQKPTGEALREGIDRFMRDGHQSFSSNMTTPLIERSHDFI